LIRLEKNPWPLAANLDGHSMPRHYKRDAQDAQ